MNKLPKEWLNVSGSGFFFWLIDLSIDSDLFCKTAEQKETGMRQDSQESSHVRVLYKTDLSPDLY